MSLSLLSVGVLSGDAYMLDDGRAGISCAHTSCTGTYPASSP